MNYRKHQNSKEVNRIVEERYLQDKFLIESKKEVSEKKPEIKKPSNENNKANSTNNVKEEKKQSRNFSYNI